MSSIDDYTNQIHQGDVLDVLADLPENSVHMVMCSPPYWGLRDYGDTNNRVWGGAADCNHTWGEKLEVQERGKAGAGNTGNHGKIIPGQDTSQQRGQYCIECGAWYGQLGLEPTFTEYVSHLVEIGAAIKRVLRPDGNWWINLGDTYSGGGGVGGKPDDWDDLHNDAVFPENPVGRSTSLGEKNKCLIPHRVAIALQDAGWIVRQDCVWAKPNPMPHPVDDRLNETTEYIFHLTPNEQYYFDLDAIREPHKEQSLERAQHAYSDGRDPSEEPASNGLHDRGFENKALHPNGKNPGDVFDIPVQPFPDAHFAVYPPELVSKPVKATCPERVCSACGAPYETEIIDVPVWELDDPDRPQLKRAIELAEQHGLTTEHLEACRAKGFSDAAHGKQQSGSGRNTDRVEELAAEAKDALGGYFREFTTTYQRPGDPVPTCDCGMQTTESGIVLDPFAGAGTTCLVAKRFDRRFIGIELNPEYVAMAQSRVGVDVTNPELLLDDDEQPLTAFTDGGR